ncbi:MAG: hypothetical protein R6U63_14275 [Longimicrobiales bacterium]
MPDTAHTTNAVALVVALLSASAAAAQEAYTYQVRDAGGGYRMGGEAPREFDFSRDRSPVRVIQGPEFTWVVPEGRVDTLTRENAVMILSRNVPVRPGMGDVVVRGWRPARVARYDSFSVHFDRGDRDREVAGRTAHHYRLEAHIRRTSSVDGSDQRFEYDADFWVLPDVPHSWAPFGFGTQSLPVLAPRLRDTLNTRLGELGLVGHAVIHMDFAMFQDGEEADGSRQTTAFLVSDIERVDPPPAPGHAVDQSVMDHLEQRLLQDPAATCTAAAEGRLPADFDDVTDDARPALLAFITDGCRSPELYSGMLEDRLEEEPAALCEEIEAAEDPAALADAVFTETQRAAFMDFVTEADRIGFLGELRGYCQRRGGGGGD